MNRNRPAASLIHVFFSCTAHLHCLTHLHLAFIYCLWFQVSCQGSRTKCTELILHCCSLALVSSSVCLGSLLVIHISHKVQKSACEVMWKRCCLSSGVNMSVNGRVCSERDRNDELTDVKNVTAPSSYDSWDRLRLTTVTLNSGTREEVKGRESSGQRRWRWINEAGWWGCYWPQW